MKSERPSYDAIVCLGKNWQRKSESRQTGVFYPSTDTARTAIACGELYKDGESKRLLFPTGHTITDGPGENEAGFHQLRSTFSEEEIPDSAIHIVKRSDSIDTAGDADATLAEAKAEGLTALKLVTIRRHLPRATALFKNYGVPIVATEATEDILEARGFELKGSIGETLMQGLDSVIEIGLRAELRLDPYGTRLRRITRLIRR